MLYFNTNVGATLHTLQFRPLGLKLTLPNKYHLTIEASSHEGP